MKRAGVRAEVKRLEREDPAFGRWPFRVRGDRLATFEASPQEEEMLVAALAAADRGETVPVSEVLSLLRKRRRWPFCRCISRSSRGIHDLAHPPRRESAAARRGVRCAHAR